ncbi:hypothetical protein CC80DRAFT_507704 [Byssothecium circinans]|uniref:Uncharacterized protein n=1 Tax=Byssothecium circinans TaxID=147558 RepID=A0A6A5TJD2_9PLEO|nr:hypothetical protein CC80DRAFT_507704 [Byssothecium circinans]
MYRDILTEELTFSQTMPDTSPFPSLILDNITFEEEEAIMAAYNAASGLPPTSEPSPSPTLPPSPLAFLGPRSAITEAVDHVPATILKSEKTFRLREDDAFKLFSIAFQNVDGPDLALISSTGKATPLVEEFTNWTEMWKSSSCAPFREVNPRTMYHQLRFLLEINFAQYIVKQPTLRRIYVKDKEMADVLCVTLRGPYEVRVGRTRVVGREKSEVVTKLVWPEDCEREAHWAVELCEALGAKKGPQRLGDVWRVWKYWMEVLEVFVRLCCFVDGSVL